MEKPYLMALDQGTTSSRCIIFDRAGNILSKAQKEFKQYYPQPGWVEQDATEIWASQMGVAVEAMLKLGISSSEIAAIGITNQRETVVVWDKKTGIPICPAIVWQCRRTADYCKELKEKGLEKRIHEKTGLLLDPYFSATKLHWILENVPNARKRAEAGELSFGTIDSWLIYQLTGKKVHATDPSNAARTLLFNIHTMQWDEELLRLFDIPASMLPTVKPSSGLFGYTEQELLEAEIPIAGVAGDQQAALFGQCCFEGGDVKNTYGTGGFMLMNTGNKPVESTSGLLTTVGWQIGNQVNYVLEGSVFVCGAVMQWLRDGLRLYSNVAESEKMARSVPDNGGVYLVPAFVGLGAPYWDAFARGSMQGLTRGTTAEHIVRAGLEAMAYQIEDVLDAMKADSPYPIGSLFVDGGASANNFLLQFQADILGFDISRPVCIETTAWGAATLAGLGVGFYQNIEELKAAHSIDKTFSPIMDAAQRQTLLSNWHRAVERSKQWAE